MIKWSGNLEMLREITIFADDMNNSIQEVKWSENVILVDGDYVDHVAFNLIVNFERMLERRIPKADMARWLECVALDGGLRPVSPAGNTQVILIHSKEKVLLENFAPGNYEGELNGKAFEGQLGEFSLSAYPVEDLADADHFFTEALQLIASQKEVKRLMVVPNAEDAHIYNKVREVLRSVAEMEKQVTVFAMQPMTGGNFRQEILGYSLMAALGIRSEEINCK
jgi:hypothetical protein